MIHDELQGLARALFEETDDALFLLDADNGRVLDANAAAQRLTGFSVRAVMDAPVSDFFRLSAGQWAITFPMPARTLPLPHVEWGGLLRTVRGAALPVDVVFTRLGTRPRPVALARVREVAPSAAENGNGGKLKKLVAAVADCLWSAEVTGPDDGQFRYLSPVIEQIVGRPAGSVPTSLRSWREMIHPDDRPEWDEHVDLRRDGQSTQVEYRVEWPDGSVRWVRDDARVVRTTGGRSVWLYGVFSDITAWRTAEEFLRRRAALVDTAEDAIVSQSAAGLIVDWNRGAEQLYGYTREEVRARPMLRLFPPDAAAEFVDVVRRVRDGEPSRPYRTTQVRKSGERIAVSVRVSCIGEGDADVSIIARETPADCEEVLELPADRDSAAGRDGVTAGRPTRTA
jgi:PAS domain S-box-containing protein